LTEEGLKRVDLATGSTVSSGWRECTTKGLSTAVPWPSHRGKRFVIARGECGGKTKRRFGWKSGMRQTGQMLRVWAEIYKQTDFSLSGFRIARVCNYAT